MNQHDADILARCRKGYETAYADLYAAHAGRVKTYFLRSGFESSDADDLTQETFARAFAALRQFNPRKGSLPTWLGAIARNLARRYWRKQSHTDSFDPSLAEDVFVSPDVAAAAAAQKEQFSALAECLETLEETLRTTVRLRYVDGLTTRAIAQRTNIPESTVRFRLDEARTLLGRLLREKGFRS
jgi:RNA polymerase sigma factor (sigma-70 family)